MLANELVSSESLHILTRLSIRCTHTLTIALQPLHCPEHVVERSATLEEGGSSILETSSLSTDDNEMRAVADRAYSA